METDTKKKHVKPDFCQAHCKCVTCHCQERQTREQRIKIASILEAEAHKDLLDHEPVGENFKCCQENCKDCYDVLC